MSQSSSATPVSRREFLRAGMRYGSLAAAGLAVTSLVLRRRVDTTAGGCAPHKFCAACVRLRFCHLPPAPAARLALHLPQP